MKRVVLCACLIGGQSLAAAQPKPKALRSATLPAAELPSRAATRAVVTAGLPRLARDPADAHDRISSIHYELVPATLGKRTKPPGIRLTSRLGVSVKKKVVMLGRRF